MNTNKSIITNILNILPDNLVYCMDKEANISEFIYNIIFENKKCLINYCNKDYKKAQRKILINGGYIDDCKYLIIYHQLI